MNEVIEINAEMVRKFGGIHGLRDGGALHSAVGRLESGYYADAIEEAAALFESLSQNHPGCVAASVRAYKIRRR